MSVEGVAFAFGCLLIIGALCFNAGHTAGIKQSAAQVHAGEITIKAEPFVVTYQCKEME